MSIAYIHKDDVPFADSFPCPSGVWVDLGVAGIWEDPERYRWEIDHVKIKHVAVGQWEVEIMVENGSELFAGDDGRYVSLGDGQGGSVRGAIANVEIPDGSKIEWRNQ